MRTRWILVLTLLLAMLLTSCGPAKGVIAVRPGGTDDTAAIQAAFDEAVATPGSTIQFAKGDYYLSKPIVANNLSSTVQGAGSEKTVIHLVPDVVFGVVPSPAYPGAQVAALFLLTYDSDGAELNWEGMGWDIGGHAGAWDHGALFLHRWEGPRGLAATGMSPVWLQGVGLAPVVNTTWRDIRMRGREDPESDYEANLYSHFFENLSGTHTITDCHYDTMAAGPAFLQSRDATVQIGGDQSEDQVTARNVHDGVLLYSGSASQVAITNLRVWRENPLFTSARAAVEVEGPIGQQIHITRLDANNIAGLWFTSSYEGVSEPSTILVEDSDIVLDPELDVAGIEIHEQAAAKSQFTFTNNRIEGVNAASALVYTSGTRGVVMTGNTFAGSGRIGLWLGVLRAEDSDMLVQDNNLEGWTTVEGGKAGIWLGNRTSGITVSGCGDPAVVVQDDTDDPATPAYDGENIIEGL